MRAGVAPSPGPSRLTVELSIVSPAARPRCPAGTSDMLRAYTEPWAYSTSRLTRPLSWIGNDGVTVIVNCGHAFGSEIDEKRNPSQALPSRITKIGPLTFWPAATRVRAPNAQLYRSPAERWKPVCLRYSQ